LYLLTLICNASGWIHVPLRTPKADVIANKLLEFLHLWLPSIKRSDNIRSNLLRFKKAEHRSPIFYAISLSKSWKYWNN